MVHDQRREMEGEMAENPEGRMEEGRLVAWLAVLVVRRPVVIWSGCFLCCSLGFSM